MSFADNEVEKTYQQLAQSSHPEDQRVFLALRRIRRSIARSFGLGERIPGNQVPAVYKPFVGRHTVLKLELGELGSAFYFVSGHEVRIVDIV